MADKMGRAGQWIGLNDKDGVPIYIGDIIRIADDPERTAVGDPVINDRARVWYMAPEVVAKSLTKPGSYSLVDWGYGEDVQQFTVLGNEATDA